MESRMLRHKATIQGARVAFGFSGITDEDEAQATPGFAGARDVTPKAARSVPLDPFAEIPAAPAAEPEPAPVVEAEVVEPAPDVVEPDPMDDALLTDFLDSVNEAPDAPTLTSYVQQANTDFAGAKQEIAKRAINNRAKSLGVKWSKEKGAFV